jgi:putative ABC transport system permease protein
MKFPLYLSIQNLLRHPGRNFLYILGISITAALLLDMILLSNGLKVSLLRVLNEMGWEIRLSPRGTFPFETDAQIYGYQKLRAMLQKEPGIQDIDAVYGTNLVIQHGKDSFTAFAGGLDLHAPILYQLTEGRKPSGSEVLVNHYLSVEKNIRPGDQLQIGLLNQSQSTGNYERTRVTVSGVAYFALDAEGQYTVGCPLAFLQQLTGQSKNDPVSIVMINLRDPKDAKRIADKINRSFPQLSAYTIQSVVQALDQQLSYFKQFGLILGGISLIVTFVLILIITTISFHDRVGEIALLRAIGLGNKTIFSAILLEGVLTSIIAAILGFGLGKLFALYLDSVLKTAPGLPEDFSFFVMEPGSLVRALITLLITGFTAGLYPAAAALRLPVADTLREEIL